MAFSPFGDDTKPLHSFDGFFDLNGALTYGSSSGGTVYPVMAMALVELVEGKKSEML